jgi:hypothetical protein
MTGESFGLVEKLNGVDGETFFVPEQMRIGLPLPAARYALGLASHGRNVPVGCDTQRVLLIDDDLLDKLPGGIGSKLKGLL